MVSLAGASPWPRRRNNRKTLTCKNGSVIPDTSCSGLYPVVTSAFKLRTSRGTACKVTKSDLRSRGALVDS
jgi:hypothetical protein